MLRCDMNCRPSKDPFFPHELQSPHISTIDTRSRAGPIYLKCLNLNLSTGQVQVFDDNNITDFTIIRKSFCMCTR